MRRICRTAHDKVADFRRGRSRLPDERFVAGCGLPDRPEAARVALGVRRAVAGVGLVDPLFIRPEDRFPEELGALPLWDSLDWMAFLLELEEELGGPPPTTIEGWGPRGAFSVGQLARAVYESMGGHDGPPA